MSTTINSVQRPNAAELRNLIAEGRKHDAAMTHAPWTTPDARRAQGGVNATMSDGFERQVAMACGQAPQFDDVEDVQAALSANAAGIAWLRTNLGPLIDALEHHVAAVDKLRAENEQLAARRDELLALVAKVSRETPYPAELDECRSARSALIAEVGTLRATCAELHAASTSALEGLDQLEWTPEAHEQQRAESSDYIDGWNDARAAALAAIADLRYGAAAPSPQPVTPGDAP